MKKITNYLIQYWYLYVIAIFSMVLQVSLDMLSPQITKRIIDDVIGKEEIHLLAPLLGIIFIIGLGRAIFGYLKEFLFDYTSAKIALQVRQNLFAHIQKLSIRFFHQYNTGELMSRIKDDVDRIWAATGYVGMLIVEVTFHTIIVLVCMFQLSPRLFIIPMITMPFVGGLAIVMEQKLKNIYENISEENAVLNTVAQENLAGVRTVKAFAREKFEIKKFLSHNQRYYELNMKQSKVLVQYQPIFQLVTKILPVITIIYGGYLVIHNEMTLGSLGAFIEYCTNIVWPMEMLGWLFNDFAAALASHRRIQKIYQEEPDILEEIKPVKMEHLEGGIIFDHVDFSLEGKQILKDICFKLNPGKTIGIMGETGSGKSSIIQLLQRFYDVDAGIIMIDGIDIRKMSFEDIRKNIALVMQDVFLFSDTIESNVKFGKQRETEFREVENALDQAQAKEFISHLPHHYQTLIGERGVGLSGGQKQRISIARALSKKTPILILDDSTSALDMETEKCIQKNLNQLEHITKMIVAHRISAVCHADEIIVLKDGKIYERGTHEELLAMHGLYYETYVAQYGDVLNIL